MCPYVTTTNIKEHETGQNILKIKEHHLVSNNNNTRMKNFFNVVCTV